MRSKGGKQKPVISSGDILGKEKRTRGGESSMNVDRSYWNNLKGLLMSLVVIGHFIQVYFEKCGGV